MIRLARFLKPFTVFLLLSIGLLFLQALADLSLPYYTGNIVNVGIQQGGIQNAVPMAVRQSQMEKLLIFMTDEDAEKVLSAYTLYDSSSAEYDELVTEYPAIENEAIFVLTDDSSMTIETLNPIMGRAWLAVSGIEQAMSNPEAMSDSSEDMASAFDLSMIPEGADVFAILDALPSQMLTPMLEQMESGFEVLGDNFIIQAAVLPIKAEYEALGVDTASLQNNYILRTGLTMLMLSLFSVSAAVTVGYFASKTAAGLARDLRLAVFTKVESFSNVEFDKFSVSSLITRTTNDITQLQMLVVMLIRIVFYAPILGIGGIIMALNTNASMWWTLALALSALVILIATIFSVALPKFRIIQKLVDRLNQVSRENLSGMMVVRAFNTQTFEEQRFDKANQDLTDTNLFVGRVVAAMMPMMMLIMNLTTLLIIWVGANQVAASSMQVGDMIAFMQYAMQVVMGFLMMSFVFIMLPRAAVSADRIADVIETETTIVDPEKPVSFSESFVPQIEFRNVTFRYPGAEEDVLHQLDFVAKPGETTAIIGSTGSGKSTLVNLIPRFYDVTDGSILINDLDVRDITQTDLRDKIGYIAQRASLFTGTIESNLLYGDENASSDMVKEAAEIAQASHFIAEKPQGYETEISQDGGNVSGGQRQRLSIARALVKNPPIFIFDDSFSALDYKTDAALRRALKQRTKESTVLIVSQRVSTIRNAEQIIVLDEGRIVGKGRHDDLMKTCDVYREIVQSQLGIEEIA